ncbi:2Fe-2S iron-sulfur cluster-binding protein [Paenibacillus sp. N1-5-1-14]|uniref:2Fe-2S iron-sulfur cluster-binding protein n=1 Tax=Paenibacillus radicibacter TaxID=2972488 RepID=UPI0021590385|nr:2Fe-2S iron-sulfur cluster-binding protein [Paenibacillus radicibacter]MCR8642304.1 2Fe-2S iron-sulfur cluster-binding protein [Paenibacillus radicibacter]
MATVEVTFLPDHKKVQVRPGTTLLDAARRAKVHIRTRCDGKAACLMCKVQVQETCTSGLMVPNQNERLKLGSSIQEGYRLSCQAKVNSAVTVTVLEDPLKAAVRRQLERAREEDELF